MVRSVNGPPRVKNDAISFYCDINVTSRLQMWLFSKNWTSILHIEFKTKNGNADYLEESYSKDWWNSWTPISLGRIPFLLDIGGRGQKGMTCRVSYTAYALCPAVCIPSRWTVQNLDRLVHRTLDQSKCRKLFSSKLTKWFNTLDADSVVN